MHWENLQLYEVTCSHSLACSLETPKLFSLLLAFQWLSNGLLCIVLTLSMIRLGYMCCATYKTQVLLTVCSYFNHWKGGFLFPLRTFFVIAMQAVVCVGDWFVKRCDFSVSQYVGKVICGGRQMLSKLFYASLSSERLLVTCNQILYIVTYF